MFHTDSQEQTIYRSLVGQLQLGFFQDEEKFPSVLEIASYYQVSYYPAQRALKALERDGLIKLRRGRETIILDKPHEDYLQSSTFRNRLAALIDLTKALELLSQSICFQGFCAMDEETVSQLSAAGKTYQHQGKRLYRLFDQALRSLGNQTVLNLYYDIGAFLESAFLDILTKEKGDTASKAFLESLTESLLDVLKDCRDYRYDVAKIKLRDIRLCFFQDINAYCAQLSKDVPTEEQEHFIWEPLKGRKKYCDLIAIDLACKINEGKHPVGTKLPSKTVLAKTYHVSEITIRRAIDLLNKSAITKNFNGIGTKVMSTVGLSVRDSFQNLMVDEHLITFLESLQFLAITSEAVVGYTLPYCSEKILEPIKYAIENIDESVAAMTAINSACLQAISCACPIAAIREVYQKITILLLNGSILRFDGEQQISQWDDIAAKLSESFNAGDYQNFAKSFSQMAARTYIEVKERLGKLGLNEVENIADLIILER